MSEQNIDQSHIEVERKLLNLMLLHADVVDEVMDGNITVDFFSERHQPLAQAIFYTASISDGKRLLTDKHYRTLLIEQGGKGDISIPMQVYHSCRYGVKHTNTKDDFDLLVRQLIEAYVYRGGLDAMRKFNTNVSKMGYVGATKQYREDLDCVLDLTEIKKSVFSTVNEKKLDFVGRIKEKRSNPHDLVKCGISEIDNAMNVGFKAGHTSLFIAATGGNKCLAHYEKCVLKDGSWVSASDLYIRARLGEDLFIMSFNDHDGSLYYQPISHVISNGIKKCLRITTSLGFKVDVTENHPFLQSHGYTNAEHLSVGEHVGIAQNLEAVENLAKTQSSIDLDKFSEMVNSKSKYSDVADIVWDQVISIEDIGEHQTYDISMPYHHNFVTNGFVTHNTNVMLNIALELYRNTGKQVLFIPLEMDWEDFVTRMVANTTEIPYTKLLSPNLLSEDEVKKIEESKLWVYENFGIIDVEDRLSLSGLKRELDKRINYFKPALVVVDYLSLLKTEQRSGLRHDLALGELAKGLKFMGKSYGFHVMTAAQLGRSDIKRIREEGADAQLDSTAVKDSQEVPSHAEFVFAMTSVPDEENRLKLHVVKSRYGPHGYTKELHLNASICKVAGTESSDSPIDSGNFGLDIEQKLNTPPEVVLEDKAKKIEFQTVDYELDDIG